jgi:hypothetical protein
MYVYYKYIAVRTISPKKLRLLKYLNSLNTISIIVFKQFMNREKESLNILRKLKEKSDYVKWNKDKKSRIFRANCKKD